MLKLSFLFFLIFFANVFWASLDNVSLFSDVQELVILCVSVLLFVAGILRAEASAQDKSTTVAQDNES